MTKSSANTHARAWKLAASMLALSMGAGLATTAQAQTGPEGVWDAPAIVPNLTLQPNLAPPAGILDSGVTGVGQIVTETFPTDGLVGTCTGTLINPRTVIFAAHCVNTSPASAYGDGGIGLSVGFEANNVPGLLSWLFNNPRQTNTALSIYNANQVWYDPRSLALGPANNFLQGDVAIATLDTHANNIPTWTLLFSPLTEATHVTIIGYGSTGNAIQGAITASGFRRRAAENMLDSLASLADRNAFLFGTPSPLVQNLYSFDFDDPANPPYNPAAGSFDFNLFGGLDTPRESITAPGDSGGPLVVDQRFDRPVVAGVLSGGSRFFGPQPFSSYGTQSFYQPLFLFWDVIVQNNPYVYASANAGDGSWLDPSHWTQDMDPNYAVVRDGQLANDLPDTPALGVSGDSVQFGQFCFLTTCVSSAAAGPGANSAGPGLVIAGGPGSTNFVPNNIAPNRLTGVKARYFDVTLDEVGTTWLDGAVTIDRLTMDNGDATLDVQSAGSLSVLSDFTVGSGWLNVDGVVRSGEALFVQGILTGTGLFDPTFFTSVASAIAPNGVDVGTLSIRGDVILASGTQFFAEVGRAGADQLRVLADPAQGTAGNIDLGGDLRMVKAANGPAPRHGQIFDLIVADGAVTNTFDEVYAQTGVLRPLLTYLPNAVRIELRAGKFADVLEGNVHELAFAHALDQLRDGSYNALYGLYGELDVMEFGQLSRVFGSLAPTSLFDARGLMAMQDGGFATTLQDRLSLLSREASAPAGMSLMGAPSDVFAFSGDSGISAAGDLAFASTFAQTRTVTSLPNGMTGFFSGGYDESRVSPVSGRAALRSDDAMRTWSMAGGVEQNFGDFTLGVAASYGRGQALQTEAGARAENDLAQSAVYGVYRFDDGLYVSGLVGVGTSRTTTERRFMAGTLNYHMQGETNGSIALASIEGGVNIDLARDVVLTPRVSIQQTQLRMDGFTEAGGGETALAFDEQVYDRLEARFAVSLAGDFSLASGWRLAPNIDVAAVSNLAGDENGVWARFAAADEVSFYLPGQARDDFWGEVTAGFALSRDDTSIGLRMEQSVERQELHDNRVMARFAQRF